MCDHSFISYDPDNDPDHPFLCKECDGTWAYHPHDKVAIDALVDNVMCSHTWNEEKCDNFAEIDSDYCDQHSGKVRLWSDQSISCPGGLSGMVVMQKPTPPGNPGSPAG